MDKNDLLRLIEDDDMGLLHVKPKQSSAATTDERLVASFHQINQFIKENGREPETGGSVQEHQLYARLKGIRDSQEKIQALTDLDEYELLSTPSKEVKSIDDIFEDDDLGIFEEGAESIFKFKHVKAIDRDSPDYVAKRKKCNDFEKYEELFEKIHADLKAGCRKLRGFTDKGETLKQGGFYVLGGVLLFLENIDITSPEKTIEGKRFRKDGRTRCIFENGTESDMLYRSLAKSLYQDGRIVTEHSEKLLDELNQITEDDEDTGYIYILKSLSPDPKIADLNNLYKIGFSSVPTEQRVKNAKTDPTYLMAPVSIVAEYRCLNLNPQKMEQLLHNFFGSACLNVDIFDLNGNRHSPREWFIAPLDVIDQAVSLIISGNIVDYAYDEQEQTAILR